MDTQTQSLDGGKTPGESLPPIVETNGAAGDGVKVPAASTHAETLVIEHDGLRGGKGRRDGLTPGSDEAAEADKLYKNIRRWQDNNPGKEHKAEKSLCPAMREHFAERRNGLNTVRIEAAKTREARAVRPAYLNKPGESAPAPLPSAPPLDETSGSEIANVDDAARAAGVALETWQGTDFEPVLIELVKVLKQWQAAKRERQMIVAQFPPEVAKEILQDCEWPESLENLFSKHVGRVLAKCLSSASVPIAYKDEIVAASAMLSIVSIEIRGSLRIAKMIAKLKANPAPKPA